MNIVHRNIYKDRFILKNLYFSHITCLHRVDEMKACNMTDKVFLITDNVYKMPNEHKK